MKKEQEGGQVASGTEGTKERNLSENLQGLRKYIQIYSRYQWLNGYSPDDRTASGSLGNILLFGEVEECNWLLGHAEHLSTSAKI